MFSGANSVARSHTIQDLGKGKNTSDGWFAAMDSRRARARVRLTDYTHLSMSERTLSRLKYHKFYPSLMDALCQVSSNPNVLVDSYAEDAINFLKERRIEEGLDIVSSPNDALDYLLDAVIDRFGYSARDVSGAVFNYGWHTLYHEEAFHAFTQKQFQKAVFALISKNRCNDIISDRILTINPIQRGPLESVRWQLDFKSTWVAKNVIQNLGKSEDKEVRRQIGHLRSVPGGQLLGGQLLEPFAHDFIVNATSGFWSLIEMKTNNADPPTFTWDRSSLTIYDAKLVKKSREIIKLQTIDDLSTYLERIHDAYFMPWDPNFPLFDSFVIDFGHSAMSAFLWVFQITSSRKHEGSAKGYQKIREIVKILKEELGKKVPAKRAKTREGDAASTPLVHLRYVLVVAKGESEPLKWKFPKGWNENRKQNDHCGPVYCMEVPIPVCF